MSIRNNYLRTSNCDCDSKVERNRVEVVSEVVAVVVTSEITFAQQLVDISIQLVDLGTRWFGLYFGL